MLYYFSYMWNLKGEMLIESEERSAVAPETVELEGRHRRTVFFFNLTKLNYILELFVPRFP